MDSCSADLHTIEIVVSNMHLPDGTRAAVPQREFVVLPHIPLPDTGFHLSSFGQETKARKMAGNETRHP